MYAPITAMALYYQLNKGDVNDYIDCDNSFKFGISLFIIGQIGNLYHHWLLRQNKLKNNTRNEPYVVPKGGLFSLLWSPQYLFEFMAWIGMATTSRHASFWVCAPSIFGYLSGRAVRAKGWYENRFGDKCPDRKAIVPFVL